MKNPDGPSFPGGFLGEAFVPCIWMSAGLIAYKACDRELECDGCPFDAAMRGALPAPVAAGPEDDSWTFPDDRSYHLGHAWVLAVDDGHARVGVDMLAARLLAQATAVILPALDSRVRCDQVACWLRDGAELIPLRAPASGCVLRHNPLVKRSPRVVHTDPYGSGWLFDMSLERGGAPEPRLLSADEMRAHSERQLEQVAIGLREHLVSERELVGPTLADGGERLADLRGILGGPAYLRLVASLLR